MHVEARAHVPVPLGKAWDLLADLGALAQWAPDVAASPADALRIGAVRQAHLKVPAAGKSVLVERVVAVGAYSFTYDIDGGIGPLAEIRTTWTLTPAPGGCDAVVQSDVRLTGLARLVQPLARRAWRKQMQALADAFAAWAPRQA